MLIGLCVSFAYSPFPIATFIVANLAVTKFPPPACSSHTAALYRNLMIVSGGSSGSKRSHSMHILDIDTLTWNQPTVQGAKPSACLGHSATLVESEGAEVLDFFIW